jgi:hypothetical protein
VFPACLRSGDQRIVSALLLIRLHSFRRLELAFERTDFTFSVTVLQFGGDIYGFAE